MDAILVLDDDPCCREMLADILGRRGYSVVTAEDGVAALDALGDATPALVLLDLAMPKVDGLTALRELRSDGRWKDLPVVLLSGAVDRASARAAADLGVKACLAKAQFIIEMLFDTVGRCVRPAAA